MQELIDRALAEDIGAGDLTTAAVVPAGAAGRGVIAQKAPGAIAGLRVAEAVFRRVDPALRWHAHVSDGEWHEEELVAEVAGAAGPILAGERVALNFLGRLSGIATLTARFVRAVEGTGTRVLDTRKTTPGLRALEKQAVLAGGGENHRAGLYDAILVKENHVALAGGVGPATERAVAAAERLHAGRGGLGGRPEVTIECATIADVDDALTAGAPRLLLDNMAPDELRAAAERARGRAVLEASGGITLDNVREVAEAGVDFISAGALTHSAPALDVSLAVEPL